VFRKGIINNSAIQMEITPEILKNVIYDTRSRIFYCSEKPRSPLRSFDRIYEFSSNQHDISDAYKVDRPTYITNYLHSCIGHAYIDTTIPLLSILYEYNPEILSKRGYQLFVLSDTFKEYTTDSRLIEHLDRWEQNTVDYSGYYRGPYRHFHTCFSDVPILFEKSFSTHRYIRFSTIIYGGNIECQRTIHNCAEKYPNRRTIPIATDEQIEKWNSIGRDAFAKYIGLSIGERSRLLFIARRGTREFTQSSIHKIRSILESDPIYLEDYSFEEQIQMFAEATLVVSSHGSGLYHLIWCSPGTRVVEIFATNDSRKIIFQSLSKFARLNYSRIECSEKEIISDNPIDLPDSCITQLSSALP